MVTEGNACGAIRSLSGPSGTGRCFAPQGMRIATSAYGLLAMTRKIEPGPSFDGAVRTPREGCPYGKTCRAVGLRPPLAIHGGYRDDREGRPYARHKNSPPA